MSYRKSIKKVKLQITALDASNGEVITYSIDYVNPNATEEQLHAAAELLNDTFTTNTFSSVQRIEYAYLMEE